MCSGIGIKEHALYVYLKQEWRLFSWDELSFDTLPVPFGDRGPRSNNNQGLRNLLNQYSKTEKVKKHKINTEFYGCVPWNDNVL